MKRRPRIIELTPLLDIILILLFVFIFNATSIEADKETQLDLKENEIQFLEDELEIIKENKNSEIENLKNELLENKQEITRLRALNDLEKESLVSIQEAMSKLLNLRKEEMDELLELGSRKEKDELFERLDKLIDSKIVLREIERYSEVTKRFYYIDVMLGGELNQIYINGQKTDIYVTKYDLDERSREDKTEEIGRIILDELEKREGGFSLALITYGIKDREVYQFAYEILEDSLVNVRERYGIEKLFLAEYNFIGGDSDD